MEWIDGNIGSKVTMKYPACYLLGEHAKGETLSVAFAGEGQHQDAGAKMVHAAPHTSSTIISKSVARGGGRTSYRGLVQVQEGAHGSQVDGEVRRAARRHDQPLRHLPLRRRPRGRRVDGPRGDRLQGQRRPALLPDEPRPDRGRGDGDDRARLRRADRQGAARWSTRSSSTGSSSCRWKGPSAEHRPALPPRSSSPETGGFSGKPHSHGATPVPGDSRGERRRVLRRWPTSTCPNGREEEWRFTPLDRLRHLHEDDGRRRRQGRRRGRRRPRGRRSRPSAAATPGSARPACRPTASRPAPGRRSRRPPSSRCPRDAVASRADRRHAARRRRRAGRGLRPPARRRRAVRAGASSCSTTPAARRYADNVEVLVGDGAALTLVSRHDWADDAVHARAALGHGRPRRPVQEHRRDPRRRPGPASHPRRGSPAPGGDVELLGALLRRRRPAPRAPAVRRPRRAALPQQRRPTRARCRATRRTPSGSATC